MREESRRMRNNRIRRKRQLRQRIMMGVLALCTSLLLAVTVCGTFSKAQEEDHTVHYKYYTSIMVENGDTLTDIAEQYAGDHYATLTAYVDEVASINNLDSRDEITAGEYLVVPYYSTQFH